MRLSQVAAGGFTLLELLVTTTVIATLGSFALLGLRGSLTRARIAQSSANLRTLAQANLLYVAEHGTYCPAADQFNNLRWHGRRNASGEPFDPTKGLLAEYLGESRSVVLCPLFGALAGDNSSFEQGTGGYGYNAQYIGGKPGGLYDRKTRLLIPERPAGVADPARTVMFTTTGYARSDGIQEYPTCDPPFWDFGSGRLSMRPSPTVHFRADGKAIVAWCDGHISLEAPNSATPGYNPHGGDATRFHLGWFGPETNNGHWNSRKPQAAR